jgi:1-aminocyclopropane-1-carboxylate deaminase/D-cysteine desulfhydrase-like pyridoxal-dependent ACC family enzyme
MGNKTEAHISRSELRKRINAIPRSSLGYYPTPLDDAPRLSAELGGPRILIKREDVSGLALGGNKTRMMEFYMADALNRDSDSVVIGLRAQSNFARQAVAAARKVGLEPFVILGGIQDVYQGNVLLDDLLGANIRNVETTDLPTLYTMADELGAELISRGNRPYVLNHHFNNLPLETVSFVDCTLELWDQMEARHIEADCIWMSSAKGTQAGLILGTRSLELDCRIMATNYFDHKSSWEIQQVVAEEANSAAELLNLDVRVSPEDVTSLSEYIGESYWTITPEAVEAIRLVGRTEGLLLDPMYTGKAMAGLVDHIRKGKFGSGETVVFIHTGGHPALFSHNRALTE